MKKLSYILLITLFSLLSGVLYSQYENITLSSLAGTYYEESGTSYYLILDLKANGKFKEKVKEFDSVESFTNAIQAFAYTQVKNVKPKDEEQRIHIPKVEEKVKKGLWD